MAEFQDVMEQFDRMCKYYQRKQECPMGCPMNGVNISQCRKVAFEEPIVTEKTVMAWAEENPEPVYPTWWEWLASIGAVTRKVTPDAASTLIDTGVLDPIPADIAQKLGLQPKMDGERRDES